MRDFAWFREAKYGMMIHRGLYSLLGGEWNGQRADKPCADGPLRNGGDPQRYPGRIPARAVEILKKAK